jgi:hypothetical protein
MSAVGHYQSLESHKNSAIGRQVFTLLETFRTVGPVMVGQMN